MEESKMKKQIFAFTLALCLCISSQKSAYTQQGYSLEQKGDSIEVPAGKMAAYVVEFTQKDIYNSIIALKEKYPDGMTWTTDEPYSYDDDDEYYCNGDRWVEINGVSLVDSGSITVGYACSAFAYELSDAAFGCLPLKMKSYKKGEFKYEDIRTGDVLGMSSNAASGHAAIVLEVNDDGIVTAEGNVNGKVRWGKKRSKDSLMERIWSCDTRYPESYTTPDNQDGMGSSSVTNTETAQTSYKVEFTEADVHNAIVMNVVRCDRKWEKGRKRYRNGTDLATYKYGYYDKNTETQIWGDDYESGISSAAFAFELSDSVFCTLPARKYVKGGFKYEDIRIGDVLRLDNDTHSVIVIESDESGVSVIEGDYNGSGKVQWGRKISKEELMGSISYYYTRYPERYILWDDPEYKDKNNNSTGKEDNNADKNSNTDKNNNPEKDNNTKENNNTDYKVKTAGGIVTQGLIYNKISGSTNKLQFAGTTIKNGLTSFEIPSSVRVFGKTYKVTSIADNALKGRTGLKKLKIGANIEHIGRGAFDGCKNLKNIIIKSKKLTIEKTNNDAFKGINSKAVIKVPKGKAEYYKKIVYAKGAGKSVKVK